MQACSLHFLCQILCELRQWQHTQDVHRLKPDKIPGLRRRSGHQAPTLTKNLQLERENHLPPMGIPKPYPQGRPHAQKYLVNLKQTSCFCILLVLFWYFLLFVLNLFLFEKEKEGHEIGWVERLERVGELERIWSKYLV